MGQNFLSIRYGISLTPQSSAPSSPAIGDFYYDSSEDTFKFNTDGNWMKLNGSADVISAANLTSTDFTSSIVQSPFIRVTGSTISNIHGLTSSSAGKSILLYNQSSVNMTIKHESATELILSNRIITSTLADIIVASKSSVQLVYDTAQSRWVLAVSASGGGSSANTTLSNLGATAINASLMPAGDGTIHLGDNTHKWGNIDGNYHGIYQNATFYNSTTPRGVIRAIDTSTPAGWTANFVIRNPATGSSDNTLGIWTANSSVADVNSTGHLYIETGNKTAGTGNSGNTFIQTGTSLGGVTGTVEIFTGVQTGTTSNGTGNAKFYTGNCTNAAGTGYSGRIEIYTGWTNGAGSYSGNLLIYTGDQPSGAGGSGTVTIRTGTAGTGYGSGNINLFVGTVSGGSRGVVNITPSLRINGTTSGFVGLAVPAIAGSTTYILPSADGTTGQVLSTNGSGTLSWISASGSMPVLPNNTYLKARDFSNSTDINLLALDASNITQLTNSYSTGALYITTADISSGGTTTGNIKILTGYKSGGTSGDSGTLEISTGIGNVSRSGAVDVHSGNQTSAAGLGTGTVTLRSGDASSGSNTGPTGDVTVSTGNHSGTGHSGHLYLKTGNQTSPSSYTGHIYLTIGTAAAGQRGSVVIDAQEIRINGSTSGYTGLKAPASPTSSILTLPATNGTATQVLSTSGSGVLTWSNSTVPVIFGSRASPRSIVAAVGITSGSGHMSTTAQVQHIYVSGSGGPVDITASPQIQAGTIDGQIMIIIGRDNTNTVTLDDGTGLSLASSYILSADKSITLRWDGTNWSEIARR